MYKGLLTALVFAFAVLITKHSGAQAHSGVPNPHTPVHQTSVVPKAVQKSYQDAIDNSFLKVTGKPQWTRQNGLLVASVAVKDDFQGSGTAIFRFKPYGGLVLIDFVSDDPAALNED